MIQPVSVTVMSIGSESVVVEVAPGGTLLAVKTGLWVKTAP
jgi:hypothetical protein